MVMKKLHKEALKVYNKMVKQGNEKIKEDRIISILGMNKRVI